jgi:hypothetical protein
MDTLRTAGLVALGVVLFVALLGGNAAVAFDRTALDSEFAKDKADETGLYAGLAEGIRSEMGSGGSAADSGWPLERSRGELLRAALTDEYVRSQGEATIDATYAYLHGERAEPRLGFDTGPLKERMLEEIRADAETIDFADTDMPFGAEIERMAESRDAFEDRRAEFRAERKAEIQERTSRELTDEELEAELDSSMGDIREEMLADMNAELDGRFEGREAELEAPVRTLQTARIDALTGETTYEEYTATVETARGNFADAFVDVAEAELDEGLPETIGPGGEPGQEGTEALETARTGVSLVSTLAIVLPVLALVIAGGIGYLAPRPIAAIEIGAVALLAGALGAVGSTVAAGQFRATFDASNAPPGIGEFVLALVTGALSAVTLQSILLVVVGVVAVSVGVALRWDYL